MVSRHYNVYSRVKDAHGDRRQWIIDPPADADGDDRERCQRKEIRGGQVRIGVIATRDVPVLREEIVEKVKARRALGADH